MRSAIDLTTLRDAIGFDVLYALSAVIPLLAGIVLVVGIYTYTGSLSPTVDESAV